MMPLVILLIDLARPGTTARLCWWQQMPRPGPHGEENDVLMELVDLWIVDTKIFMD